MLDESRKGLLEKYRSMSIKSNWLCMHPQCFNKAINSHIIQKKRYLEILSDSENKVYCTEPYMFAPDGVSIKKRSTNQVLAFPCFCANHDNKIFKKIESNGINFDDWRSLHLLNYRTALSEIRKKEISLKSFQMVLDNKRLYSNKVVMDKFMYGTKLGINDTYVTINALFKDLQKGINSEYRHHYREISHTQICIVSIFNLETSQEHEFVTKVTGKVPEFLSSIFFYLIPISKEKDMVVLSYEATKEVRVKRYLKSFFEGDETEVQKQISDLMFLQVENWVCSQEFYNSNISGREDTIRALIASNIQVEDETKPLQFNIFTS